LTRPAPAAAAAWGFIFALVHAYWAVGGRLGLPADLDLRAHTALFVVDVAAVPLCLLAAAAALTADGRIGRRLAMRWGWIGCVAVAVLCVLHSVPPLSSAVWDALTTSALPETSRERHALYLYEPWWLVGGILFTATAIRTRPKVPES